MSSSMIIGKDDEDKTTKRKVIIDRLALIENQLKGLELKKSEAERELNLAHVADIVFDKIPILEKQKKELLMLEELMNNTTEMIRNDAVNLKKLKESIKEPTERIQITKPKGKAEHIRRCENCYLKCQKDPESDAWKCIHCGDTNYYIVSESEEVYPLHVPKITKPMRMLHLQKIPFSAIKCKMCDLFYMSGGKYPENGEVPYNIHAYHWAKALGVVVNSPSIPDDLPCDYDFFLLGDERRCPQSSDSLSSTEIAKKDKGDADYYNKPFFLLGCNLHLHWWKQNESGKPQGAFSKSSGIDYTPVCNINRPHSHCETCNGITEYYEASSGYLRIGAKTKYVTKKQMIELIKPPPADIVTQILNEEIEERKNDNNNNNNNNSGVEIIPDTKGKDQKKDIKIVFQEAKKKGEQTKALLEENIKKKKKKKNTTINTRKRKRTIEETTGESGDLEMAKKIMEMEVDEIIASETKKGKLDQQSVCSCSRCRKNNNA